MTAITLPSIPHALAWAGSSQDWYVDDHTLKITADAKTDFFIDPRGVSTQDNASRLLFVPEPQFTLSARVTVQFASTFDAGALLLFASPTCWAKLCFEFSPQQQPMIVSVVTNNVSDDCNSAILTTSETYLRVTKLDGAFAFHYSANGSQWQLIRYFALAHPDELRVGFVAQSPTGDGCSVIFSDIKYTPQAVQDIRSGE